jgi:hypothetical protein
MVNINHTKYSSRVYNYIVDRKLGRHSAVVGKLQEAEVVTVACRKRNPNTDSCCYTPGNYSWNRCHRTRSPN